MCSCSNNEVLEAPESLKTPIAFGTYVGNSVEGRGGVIDDTGLQTGTNDQSVKVNGDDGGFGVFGYYTDQRSWSSAATTAAPNFMYNQQVTYASSKWSYSPLKYWPNNTDAKVTFCAYAPYATTNNANGLTGNIHFDAVNTMKDSKLTFTVNPVVTEQNDLLWASATDQSKNSTPGVSVTDKINFSFAHALAKVGFKVEAMVDEVNADADKTPNDDNTVTSEAIASGTTITVTKVELIGAFYKQGVLDLQDGTWTLDPQEKISNSDAEYLSGDYTSKAELTPTERTQEYGFKLENDNFTNDKVVSITSKQLNNEDSYIMVIPQNFTGSENVKIRVTYTVKTEDDALTGSASVVENVITSSAFNFDFQQANAYTFSLHIGMTSVKVKASVKPWTDGGDTSVNVPINK